MLTLKELVPNDTNLVEDSTRVMQRIKALFRARAICTPGVSSGRADSRGGIAFGARFRTWRNLWAQAALAVVTHSREGGLVPATHLAAHELFVGARSSPKGRSKLIAGEKNERQSAKKRTAPANRFHRTDRRLCAALARPAVEGLPLRPADPCVIY